MHKHAHIHRLVTFEQTWNLAIFFARSFTSKTRIEVECVCAYFFGRSELYERMFCRLFVSTLLLRIFGHSQSRSWCLTISKNDERKKKLVAAHIIRNVQKATIRDTHSYWKRTCVMCKKAFQTCHLCGCFEICLRVHLSHSQHVDNFDISIDWFCFVCTRIENAIAIGATTDYILNLSPLINVSKFDFHL